RRSLRRAGVDGSTPGETVLDGIGHLLADGRQIEKLFDDQGILSRLGQLSIFGRLIAKIFVEFHASPPRQQNRYRALALAARMTPDLIRGTCGESPPRMSRFALIRAAALQRLAPRPEHALVAARHGADALVDELLHPLTLVGLGRVEIALRVRGDA